MMLDNVSLHVSFLCGAVRAMGTGEGLLPGVSADVCTDALHLHSLEGTVRARERLLLGMDAKVFAQLGGDGGGEGTVGAIVEAWHGEAATGG